MYKVRIAAVVALATILVHVHETDARPYRIASRQKRISDQRLAELETLIALAKMKNKMVTIPVGFGRVDPLKIGRRKRTLDGLIKNLVADITSEEDREEEDADEYANKFNNNDEEEDLVDDNDVTQLPPDRSQRIARYRHLPVRLPE